MIEDIQASWSVDVQRVRKLCDQRFAEYRQVGNPLAHTELLRYGYYYRYRNRTRNDVKIRPAHAMDIHAIKSIAIESEMFGIEDTGFVDDIVAGILDHTLHDHHFVVQESEGGAVVGAAYHAPEPFSDRMWNLYFIAVSPPLQGQGIGGALLDHVERELRHAGPDVAQVLIVETSSTDQYSLTRKFYLKQGYLEEARIRRFYGPDDDKVVYWKLMTA